MGALKQSTAKGGKEELRASVLKPYLLRLRSEKGEKGVRQLLNGAGMDPAPAENETSWLSVTAVRRALPLHGRSLEVAARDVLHTRGDAPQAIFASFSASHWLSPYGRVPAQYFYADAGGLTALRAALKLSTTRSGANVVVTVPKDNGLF